MSTVKQRHTLTLEPEAVRRANRLRKHTSLSAFVNDALATYTNELERIAYTATPHRRCPMMNVSLLSRPQRRSSEMTPASRGSRGRRKQDVDGSIPFVSTIEDLASACACSGMPRNIWTSDG